MPTYQQTSPNCGPTTVGRTYENRRTYGISPTIDVAPAKALVIEEIWKRIKEKKGDRK